MSENIYESVDVVNKNENEVKKASKKEKIFKALKIAGIATGALAITGGIAYFFGYKFGCKDMLSSESLDQVRKQSRTAGADFFVDYVISACDSGKDVCTVHTNDDGTKKYLSYFVSDNKPDWCENDKGMDTTDVVN